MIRIEQRNKGSMSPPSNVGVRIAKWPVARRIHLEVHFEVLPAFWHQHRAAVTAIMHSQHPGGSGVTSHENSQGAHGRYVLAGRAGGCEAQPPG